MASYAWTDEIARELLTRQCAKYCPHDGAYITLSGGDAKCPTCGQFTWRWFDVPPVVHGADGREHRHVSWENQEEPAERIGCLCGRIFHAGVLNGWEKPADAFFHHMDAQNERAQRGRLRG